MFKAVFGVPPCHLKGQGVEEEFVYCESGGEEVAERVLLTRKLMKDGALKETVI